MRGWPIAGTVLWLATGAWAPASTMLFDFETDDQVALWHNEGSATLGADKKLERVERFAASGKCSMRFSTPAWRPAEHDASTGRQPDDDLSRDGIPDDEIGIGSRHATSPAAGRGQRTCPTGRRRHGSATAG